MGLIEDIKLNALNNGTKIQNSTAQEVEKIFNSLFYAPKNIDEEVKFVHQMFTRGGDGQERVGLHTSAIIVGEKEFCMRQQVLSLIYRQAQGENIQVGLKRIFEEGNAIHEKWQRLFIRGKLGKAEHMDFSMFNKDYGLGYTPDAKLKILGKRAIVEIKSVNTFQFKNMVSHPSAKKQVNMYQHFEIEKAKKAGKKYDDIFGIVLCEDKNTQEFKVFIEEYNFDIVAPYIERLEAIKYYKERVMTEGKMVGRCEQCNTYLCKRASKCPMRDACWNKGMGRQLLDV